MSGIKFEKARQRSFQIRDEVWHQVLPKYLRSFKDYRSSSAHVMPKCSRNLHPGLTPLVSWYVPLCTTPMRRRHTLERQTPWTSKWGNYYYKPRWVYCGLLSFSPLVLFLFLSSHDSWFAYALLLPFCCCLMMMMVLYSILHTLGSHMCLRCGSLILYLIWYSSVCYHQPPNSFLMLDIFTHVLIYVLYFFVFVWGGNKSHPSPQRKSNAQIFLKLFRRRV